MQNTGRLASAVAGCGFALALCGGLGAASGQSIPTSDRAAAILVWPKIVVDTSNTLTSSAGNTDTLIQLSSTVPLVGPPGAPIPNPTNVSRVKLAHCFYVNATGHCSHDPSRGCLSSDDCEIVTGQYSSCEPGWTEIDFDVRITPEQPLAWYASRGLRNFPLPSPGFCSNATNISCTSNFSCGGGTCIRVPSNVGSAVPPTPEDPFVGTLTCIQFDPTGNPARPDISETANALIGHAAIEVALASTAVDVQKYNAVGIRKKCNGTDCSVGSPITDVLILGNGNAAYDSCPARLVVNHLFDGAPNPFDAASPDTTSTDLTLVPCGNDFLRQSPGRVTAQYLVFNEFEQRFSTSSTVDCFFEQKLSNIDTPISNRSIFHFNVAGTLAGHTIIRGIGTAATGQGLLGVARLNIGADNGTAYNLNQKGNLTEPDIITIP